MHLLTKEDRQFRRDFEAGKIPPGDFDHCAHLRLAYVHLADFGPERAATTFRESLLGFLHRNGIDPRKYHETLTLAWLRAVWHFMRRAGSTTGSHDFLQRSPVLLDSRVMLEHYSKDVLFSDAARQTFVEPDIEPIPRDPER